MWDEQDGFFYDVLRLPDGEGVRLKVRSMVGLLPLVAVAIFDGNVLEKLPECRNRLLRFARLNPELFAGIHMPSEPGQYGRHMVSTVDETKLRRILEKMLDENEFFVPHGIRALSRCHHDHPFVFNCAGQDYRVSYVPGDSDTGMFGGNSNWRGPVWMPVNFLLYNSLIRLGTYYGDSFKVECPTGSGRLMNLVQVGHELATRLIGTFERDSGGRRPVFGGTGKFQSDPLWRDNLLFYEYFHGDSGAGVGASHQTGWTGCIARIIQVDGLITDSALRGGDIESLLQEMLNRQRAMAGGQ